MSRETEQLIASAQKVIDIEQQTILQLKQKINASFALACELMLACNGRIIVIGMGKSGHIGNKVAATLASTGTPAFFVHPGEASHGDLGMITSEDVILALSYSGETQEVVNLLPVMKRIGAKLISLTGNQQSTLSKFANVNLDVSVDKEACPLNLAPTASTTASLVMGDALAIALLEAKGFTAEDFALSHPGGSLGRKLLLKVEDIMHHGEQIPKVTVDTPLIEALVEMSAKRLGMTCIVNQSGEFKGVFTDGDLRRTLANSVDLQQTKIGQIMTGGGHTITATQLAAEALQIMQRNAISALVILDKKNYPAGIVHMHDLLKAGVV